MAEVSAIVNSLLYEHGAIRQYMRTVNSALNEQEEFFLKKSGEWSPSQVEILLRNQVNLQHSVTNLEDGLLNHYTREEKELPPLIGDYLTRALISEHKEVLEYLRRARMLLYDTDLKELGREELMARSYDIRMAIDNARLFIEAHLAKEDAIIQLLKKALEKS